MAKLAISRIVRVIMVAAVLIAQGCYLVPSNIDVRQAYVPDHDEAMIIATVTMHYEGRFFERAGFFFRHTESGRRFRLDSAVPWTISPMLESTPDEGLESENGILYACLVQPGTWEIQRAQLHSVPPIMAIADEPVRFDLAPGSIVYLGNLHVDLCHLIGPEGAFYVKGGSPSAVDHSARDYAMLFERYPHLKHVTIEKRILDSEELRLAFQDLWKDCPETSSAESR